MNRGPLYTARNFHDCPSHLKVTAPKHCGRSFLGRAPILQLIGDYLDEFSLGITGGEGLGKVRIQTTQEEGKQ